MCFFFSSRRRHTRWTGDWSSDVCSSDLTVMVEFMHLRTVEEDSSILVADEGILIPRVPKRLHHLHELPAALRSEEHTSELQSPVHLVCRLLLEKKKTSSHTTLNTSSPYS